MALKEIKVRLKFLSASISSNEDKVCLKGATLEPMGSCIDSKPHKLRIEGKIFCEKCGCTVCAEAIIVTN
ncbi:MAG: hypothetical protein WCI57_00580 [Candidatus Berkelbacteria bacterium]